MTLDQDKLETAKASRILNSLSVVRTPEHQAGPSSRPLAARMPTRVQRVRAQPVTALCLAHTSKQSPLKSPHPKLLGQPSQSFIIAPPTRMQIWGQERLKGPMMCQWRGDSWGRGGDPNSQHSVQILRPQRSRGHQAGRALDRHPVHPHLTHEHSPSVRTCSPLTGSWC